MNPCFPNAIYDHFEFGVPIAFLMFRSSALLLVIGMHLLYCYCELYFRSRFDQIHYCSLDILFCTTETYSYI